MADTVVYQTTAAATPPDATIIATDDAGAAGQVQIIKLAISTDGSATVIPADAANGLDVDVTRVGGTVAVTQSGTWDEVGINDSGNSITVDGTVAVTGALTDAELRASPVPISDGAGSLTVDGTVAVSAVAGTVAATQSGTWNIGTVTAVTGITNAVAVTDNSSTLSVDDGGGALTVDGTVAATQSGTWNVGTVTAVTGITNAVAVTDNAGSLTVDGTVTANLAAGTNNIGDVDILSIAAGDNNIGNVDIVTLPYDVADDAADSGNPVKVGGKAKAFDGTDPGSVAEDDRAQFITDLNRRQYVNTVHPMFWTAVENNSSAQTNNAIKAAPGAGLSLYITDIVISTDAAINAKIVEDTGGTPVTIAGPYYFAANGGAGLHFVTPIKATANKDIGYTTVGASNCTVQVHGFTAP